MLLCRRKTYSEYYFSATGDGDSIWISFTFFFNAKLGGLTQKCTKGPKCSYLSQQMWDICDNCIHGTSLFLSLQILGETFHKCLFIHSKNLFENLLVT